MGHLNLCKLSTAPNALSSNNPEINRKRGREDVKGDIKELEEAETPRV